MLAVLTQETFCLWHEHLQTYSVWFCNALFKGLITVGRELRQQHSIDNTQVIYCSAPGRPESAALPTRQQITRVLLP